MWRGAPSPSPPASRRPAGGRSLTLPPESCRLLLQWREQCPQTRRGWLFPGQAGQPLSVRGAQTAISKLADRVGAAGVTSHSFRQSALTAAHQAGLSLREVAEISGHQSLAALERYLDQDAAREKAEAARGLLLGGGLMPLPAAGITTESYEKRYFNGFKIITKAFPP